MMSMPRWVAGHTGLRTRARARVRRALLFLLGSVILASAAWPQSGAAPRTLGAQEQEIVAFIERREPAALELLERLVEINSGTMNFAGVRRVAGLLEAPFERLGFSVRWVDGSSFERAGHFVARRDAARADAVRVLLIGHLDTVFEPESPFQQWQRVDGEEGFAAVRGPGVTDMKGGDVVMLLALESLHAAGILDRLAVSVVLTGDEERAGSPLRLARQVLFEEGEWADFAIGFEDGDGDPETAVVARRGASSWKLEVRGTPAHSSQIFQTHVGAGAIFEAARVLGELRAQLVEIPDLTFNPGVVLGGTEIAFTQREARGEAFGKNNVVAEHALVTGDLRALSPQDLNRAREMMRQVVEQSLPGTQSALTFTDGYPPMAASTGNLELLRLYDEVSRDLGLGAVQAVDPRRAGAADVSFVAALVAGALDGIGLMGRDGHTVLETADLRTLGTQAQRAALFLHRLASRRPRSAQSETPGTAHARGQVPGEARQ